VSDHATDVGVFLARPLVARVAANTPQGPTVRPVWFLYEDGAFWWLTASSYSRLGAWLERDPRVALTVDTCDLVSGEVLAVHVTGKAAVVPLDRGRAVRTLVKYLGPAPETWPDRFRDALDDPTAGLVVLRPERQPKLRDLSFGAPSTS